jgi:hypothetical protein
MILLSQGSDKHGRWARAMITPASQHSIRWPSTREKSYWTQVYETHPGLAWLTPLGLVALLVFDLLQWQHLQSLSQETAQLKASVRQAENLRETASFLTERNLQLRAGQLARRKSLASRELHLALDSARGTLYLRRDGVDLREMPVALAPNSSAAGSDALSAPGAAAVASTVMGPAALPQGKRAVLSLLEGDYRWEVPDQVYRERGEPVPAQRLVAAAPGPVALVLDDGTLLYARPASGPLSDATYQVPGSILLTPDDLEAVRASLRTGLAVYLY